MTTLIEHWELLGILATRAQADVIHRDCEIEQLQIRLKNESALVERLQSLVKADGERLMKTECGKQVSTEGGKEGTCTLKPGHESPCGFFSIAGGETDAWWRPAAAGLVADVDLQMAAMLRWAAGARCEENRTKHIIDLAEAIRTELEDARCDQVDELSRNAIFVTVRAVLDRELPFSEASSKDEKA